MDENENNGCGPLVVIPGVVGIVIALVVVGVIVTALVLPYIQV